MRFATVSIGQSLGICLACGAVVAAGVAADRAARAQADAGPALAWEYKQEASVPVTDSEILDNDVLQEQQRMLQANGRDGWELASTHAFPLTSGQAGGQLNYGVVYVFKRPLR